MRGSQRRYQSGIRRGARFGGELKVQAVSIHAPPIGRPYGNTSQKSGSSDSTLLGPACRDLDEEGVMRASKRLLRQDHRGFADGSQIESNRVVVDGDLSRSRAGL